MTFPKHKEIFDRNNRRLSRVQITLLNSCTTDTHTVRDGEKHKKLTKKATSFIHENDDNPYSFSSSS